MANTYPTTDLPLGSTSPKVLYNNASNLDEATNGQQPTWTDRFGLLRRTWSGMEQDFQNFLLASGYEYVGADYVDGVPGLQFTNRNQYTVRAGVSYRPSETAVLPFTTTGNWVTDQTNFFAFSTDLNFLQDLANDTDPTKGAALVGYSGRTVADSLNDFVNVKRFGAVGDGVTDDTAAFLAAIAYLDNGTETKGGTILVPRGQYKINQKLQFDGVDSVTNYYIRGDGMLNTFLDFSGCPPNTDSIYFNGGSQVGVSDIMITGSTRHGLVLNDQTTSFVSFAEIRNVRVQYCQGYGVYSLHSYLVLMESVFATSNTGGGVNFAGNHTSIITNKVYTANNVGTGFRINGAVYVDINAQSDNNFRGYLFSNIRGGNLRALGSESNKNEGVLLVSSNATAVGIFGEYQNIHGLVMSSGCHIRNNTAGPLGNSANIAVSAEDGRPIEFTMIGVVDNVTAGDPSVAMSSTGGPVTYTEIDCQFQGPTILTPTVVRRNLSNIGKYALRSRSVGPVAIPSGALTEMVWDTGFSPGENTINAGASGNNITIPAGVSAVHVSAQVNWAGVSGGYRYLAILKNGAGLTGLPQLRVAAYGTSTTPMCISSGKPIPVVAGDNFTVVVLHDQGGSINVEGISGASNWFSVEAVR